jgi:hypothetical protein
VTDDRRGNVEAVFNVLDFEGTEVLCTRAHWIDKIEFDHPELQGLEAAVEEAVRSPEIVLQDRDYPDRKHHIRRFPEGQYAGMYLKVVAGYSYEPNRGSSTGFVVTAFIQDRLRSGDGVLFVSVRS